MAITTCTEYNAEQKRLHEQAAAKRRPVEKKYRDCTRKADERFDRADKDTSATLALAQERLARERKKCRQEYDGKMAPIDQRYSHDLDRLEEEAHHGLGFTQQLIVAWKELESDALAAQTQWQAGRRFPPPIIVVERFDQLVREFQIDRCAIELMLIAVVKENALVLDGEERSFASLATDLKPTTKLTVVDGPLRVHGRQIVKGPSVAAHSGLQRFRRMLGASGLVVALDTWRATQLTVRNKQWTDDPVVGCVPSLSGRGAVGNPTNSAGRTTLTVFQVPDGQYRLALTPNDSSTVPAGPATAPTKPPRLRVWEALETEVTVKSERIVRVASRSNLELVRDDLTADLQPVWMRSYLRSRRVPDPTMIIVHHTGSANSAKMLAQFTGKSRDPNADYTICPDGQTIKLVMDGDHTYHTGFSYWNGQVDNDNSRHSFGIEIMHARNTAYTKAQMDSLLRLLDALVDAYPTIAPERIIGHSDIATTAGKKALPARWLIRRPEDPGPLFDWAALRKRGLGIPVRPRSELPPYRSSDLRAFFKRFPLERLRPGDDDDHARYGGKNRDPSEVPANLIATLQSRLGAIGYCCIPTGHYNDQTKWVVGAFQTHFLPGEAMTKAVYQQVTAQTADMIELVA